MTIKRTSLAVSFFIFGASIVRSDGFFISTQSSDAGTSFAVQEGNTSVKTSQNITQENGFTVTVTEKTTKKPVKNTDQKSSQSTQSVQDQDGCTVTIEEQTNTENGFETTVKKTTRKCKNQPEFNQAVETKSNNDPLPEDTDHACPLDKEVEAPAESTTEEEAAFTQPIKTEKIDTDGQKDGQKTRNQANELGNELGNEINRRLEKQINRASRLSQLLNDSMFGRNFPWL
jgi:hypothetical protein